MKTGWETRSSRYFLLIFLFFVNLSFGAWLEVTKLNNGQKINTKYTNTFKIDIRTHEIVAMQFSSHHFNNSGSANFIAHIRTHANEPIPSYVDGWEDLNMQVNINENATLTNTIYIRAMEVRVDTFTIWYGETINGMNIENWFKVVVNIRETEFNYPTIFSESQYTQGTSNLITWQPAIGASYQEAYYFDKENPENLKRSVQGLYHTQSQYNQSVFKNLEHGHTYGYFIKAAFEGSSETVYMYSDFKYSTQDNVPPPTVPSPQALIKNSTNVDLTWNSVEDLLSKTAYYLIFRASDTGPEFIQDTIFVSQPQNPVLFWSNKNLNAGATYYYRIRGVDHAGNIGDGEPSNGIYIDGNFNSDDPPKDDDPDDDRKRFRNQFPTFIKGSIDTLWIELDGRETHVRFEAVRDSLDFFMNPPQLGMRYFNSGWISVGQLINYGWVNPQNPDWVYFIFDYVDTGNVYVTSTGIWQDHRGGDPIDLNFADGHTYIRRAIHKYQTNTDSTELGEVIPDCFPPTDIYNLKVHALIDDPNFLDPLSGYSHWHLELSWQAAVDRVSGLKRYHIYRKVEGVDADFQELNLPGNFISTSLIDSIARPQSGIKANPLITYRVTSEDKIGNRRGLNETQWQVQERSLWQPAFSFWDTTSSSVVLLGKDTLYTKKNTVSLKIEDFDRSSVISYEIYVNNNLRTRSNRNQDTLKINLPQQEMASIFIRALYLGKRSSIWSNQKVVYRALNLPPANVKATNDEEYWKGDIYLEWIKSSQDAVGYEVWRKDLNGNERLVYTIISNEDTLNWIDSYAFDELTQQPDTLITYAHYAYRIKAQNFFGDISAFSSFDTTYCNRPPVFVSHDSPTIYGSYFVIPVYWERVTPSLVANDFRSIIHIYEDSLTVNPVEVDTIGNDRTQYTFTKARNGHNYIFRVREIPNQFEDRPSAWSRPYTVSDLISLSSLTSLPQPGGHIYIDWLDQDLITKYKVDSFHVCRDQTCWTVSSSVTSFMDSVKNLEHGNVYTYSVYALDSLSQVVAANAIEDTCDTGSTYIPEIQLYTNRYFHADSIDIAWLWNDPEYIPEPFFKRSTYILSLDISISHTFPSDPNQTVNIGWFPAEALNSKMRVKIPPLASRANEIVHFRITAQDYWGHPVPKLWSTDFYPVKTAIYDPIYPYAVSDFDAVSQGAYYGGSDSMVVHFKWSGEGVEYLVPGSNKTWGPLYSNIAGYSIYQHNSSGDSLIYNIPVNADSALYNLEFICSNENYQWNVGAVDSAGNMTLTSWIETELFVPTPEPPIPSDYKACAIQPVIPDSGNVDYFVEIAMDPSHFQIAYEYQNGELLERFLCRSGWISTTQFECTSGWGGIQLDTTWFRVKVRNVWTSNTGESGWSSIVSYPAGAGNPGNQGAHGKYGIPTEFKVLQNYPNPFNHRTVLEYHLPEAGDVQIHIYNTQGAEVKTLIRQKKDAGYHAITWNGDNSNGIPVASGIYIYWIKVESSKGKTYQDQKKMLFIK